MTPKAEVSATMFTKSFGQLKISYIHIEANINDIKNKFIGDPN